MPRSAIAFCALLMTVAGSAGVRASGGTSEVRVRIAVARDQAASIASIGMQEQGDDDRYWSATLSGDGSATFRGLAPATYHVTVDLAGVGNATIDLRVEAAEVVSLEAAIALPAAGGAHFSVVERHRLGEGTDFRDAPLRDLPDARNLWALIDTAAPFQIADRIDNGGTGTGRTALIGSRGASFTTTSLSFGDVEIWNPDRLGVLPIWPDLGAVQAVAITSGMAPVEIAAPGAAIALVARRAGNKTGGAIDFALTTPQMVTTNDTAAAPSIARVHTFDGVGFQLGGPIGNKTRIFLSDDFSRSLQEDHTRVLQPADQAGSVFTHIVWRPTERDEVRVIGTLQGTTHAYDGRLQFQSQNATERDTFAQSAITWDQLGAAGNRVQLGFGVQRGVFTPKIGAAAGGTVDRVFDGVVPAAASAVTTGRWDGRVEFQPRDLRWGGMGHSIRVGATLAHASSSGRVLAAPSVAETVDGLPARVWLDVMPTVESHRHIFTVDGYAGDEIAVGSRFTVDAGVRGDLSRGSARGAAGISWATLSPRAAFHWSPSWLSVFGGYARYVPRLSLDLLAFGDPGASGALVYRWSDANHNGRFDDGELGALVAQAGSGQGVATIDSKLVAPHTDELTIGIGRTLGSSMSVRGALVFRREHNLLGAVNTGVTVADYRQFFVPDQAADYSSPSDDQLLAIYDRLPSSFGHDRFLLTNPAGGDASYDGAEVTWTLSSGRWYALFGAMAYRTRTFGGDRGFGALENDQGVVGEHFENPNASSAAIGSVFFDRSYVGKWSTSYHAPHDIRVGVTTRYQDGEPFTRVVIAPDLAQGPEMIEAYRTGRTRFTFTLTVDARVEKGLTIAGHPAAIRLDIFNLSNAGLEVEENVVTGPLFRQTTAVQPPRTVRVGFRFEF